MPPRRHLDLTFWALAFIGIGWVTLVEVAAWMDDGEHAFVFGLLFGTLFGHTAVAAAWVALGPGPLIYRLPLSLLWSLALILAICLPMLKQPDGSPLYFIGSMVAALWVVLQIPFWAVALGFRLRLRKGDHASASDPPRQTDSQFGIRQLMFLTAIVAVILALLRVFLPRDTFFEFDRSLILVIALLVVSQMLIVVPLALAVCLTRHAGVGVCLGLLLTACITPLENQLFRQIGGVGGPEWVHFAAFNAITALWVLAWGAMVRWGGYRLLRMPGQRVPARSDQTT